MPAKSAPKTKKIKKGYLWAGQVRDNSLSFGLEGMFTLVVRREGNRLIVETTDSNTRVEVEPFSTDMRVCFSVRSKSILVPQAD